MSSKTPTTCDEMRQMIGDFLQRGDDEAQRLWDIMTCLRGPDSPSEAGNQPAAVADKNYALRRQRKYDTVEVIREHAFFGVIGGAARHHKGDTVKVPNDEARDHFDRHVVKAAKALGLNVKVESKLSNKTNPDEVEVNFPSGMKIKKMGKLDKLQTKSMGVGGQVGQGAMSPAKKAEMYYKGLDQSGVAPETKIKMLNTLETSDPMAYEEYIKLLKEKQSAVMDYLAIA